MTTMILPYGRNNLLSEIHLQDVDIILPSSVQAASNPISVVRSALDSPVDGILLTSFIGAKSAAIAISDKTRPVPHQYLLPPLLDKLIGIGLAPENIKLIIASGIHEQMTPDQFSKILPDEIVWSYTIISHNADDERNLVYQGDTIRGTPIYINNDFVESDLRIVVGNIEPHHFMGFSGGAKSASIGLAGRSTINHNHAMIIDDNARIGEFLQNPMRQDVEEIGSRIGLHFALNSILNKDKQLVTALAGSPLEVMRAGIPILSEQCQVEVRQRYDLVVASVGGHPKDINLYQSQKALTHASLITKDGGVVILVAACPEGSGSLSFESFMVDVHSYEDVISKFLKEGFRVGPHKAIQFARQLARIHIILVSEMPSSLVKKLLLIPAANLNDAIHLAKKILPNKSKVAIMPYAINTIPKLINPE